MSKNRESMLSLELAQKLRAAGLVWQPRTHDFFALPERDMDDIVYVMSHVMSLVEKMYGNIVVAFHGAAEWALDHVMYTDAVWVPTETQLRELIWERVVLLDEEAASVALRGSVGGFVCTVTYGGKEASFSAVNASDAYALALLTLLPPISQGMNGLGAGH